MSAAYLSTANQGSYSDKKEFALAPAAGAMRMCPPCMCNVSWLSLCAQLA